MLVVSLSLSLSLSLGKKDFVLLSVKCTCTFKVYNAIYYSLENRIEFSIILNYISFIIKLGWVLLCVQKSTKPDHKICSEKHPVKTFYSDSE